MAEYYTLGNWDTKGKPDYLDDDEDIEPDILHRIDLTIPKKQPVPTHNPSYLENEQSTSIIIKTTNPSFTGADIYITFLDENAGYKNSFGYYIFPLNGDYTVPTKYISGSWVPMTFNDRYNVDGNGKSILKQTIVFPNTCRRGNGNDIKHGNRVKLLYDVNNPAIKFPNNTGVGFFVIPYGWKKDNDNDKSLKQNLNRIYTDSCFNNNNEKSTLIFYDAIKSTSDESHMILSFDDVMTGEEEDHDHGEREEYYNNYNNLIVKIFLTPAYCYDTSDMLILSNGTTNDNTEFVCDNTGFYLNVPSSTLSNLNTTNANNFRLKHTITCDTHQYKEWLKNIFNCLDLENEAVVEDDETDDKKLRITYKISKSSLKKYNHCIKTEKNKDKQSCLDPQYNVLVHLQDYYVHAGSHIQNENFEIKDYDNDETSPYVSRSCNPNVSNMDSPYSMGDPHITTISGKKYDIPNILGDVLLFDDNELKISTELDYYENNKGNKIYEKLTFMKNLKIELNNNIYLIDLFDSNSKIDLQLLKEEEYDEKIKKSMIKYYNLFPNTNPIFKYVLLNTKNLGKVILEIIYCLELKDFINSISLISNGLSMTKAKGALISPYQFKEYKLNK